MQFQRVQILHMLRTYLSPDTSDATRPSLKIHILCGEGRLKLINSSEGRRFSLRSHLQWLVLTMIDLMSLCQFVWKPL